MTTAATTRIASTSPKAPANPCSARTSNLARWPEPDTVSSMAMTGQWFDIKAGDYRAAISEVGAGLAGLWRGDRPVTSPWADGVLPPMSCGAVLLPWPNRIRDGRYSYAGSQYQLPITEPAQHNASHGLVRWVRWEVAERADHSVTLTHDLVPQTGYPFELRMHIRYALSAESGLTVSTQVTNQGRQSAPFGAGFHPYLDLDGHDLDHAELEIPAATMLLTDDRQIPVGRSSVHGTPYQLSPARPVGTLRLDNGFADLTGSKAIVKIADHTTEIWWSEEFQYLQVFTPPVQRFKRTAIAVEPMTCPADAFNSCDGLIELEAGGSWSASWGIRTS
ncbi:MAG: aldose 1-epimerase [Pseudonocardiales bacterium]|nr:aldose 1-epimerase [Pseudonocardiales bacterium]